MFARYDCLRFSMTLGANESQCTTLIDDTNKHRPVCLLSFYSLCYSFHVGYLPPTADCLANVPQWTVFFFTKISDQTNVFQAKKRKKLMKSDMNSV
jgi:hypothetical protein